MAEEQALIVEPGLARDSVLLGVEKDRQMPERVTWGDLWRKSRCLREVKTIEFFLFSFRGRLLESIREGVGSHKLNVHK